MKCKRKMQKRRDILTILGMLVLLTFHSQNVANPTADADWRVFSMPCGCCFTWAKNRNRLRLLHVWHCLRHRLRSRC